MWEWLAFLLLPPHKFITDSNQELNSNTWVSSEEEKLLVTVEESGQNALFKLNVARAQPWLCREFLGAVAREVIFVVPSSLALRNFAELLSNTFGQDMSVVPDIRMELHIFSTTNLTEAPMLSRWQPLSIAHGYAERAWEHMKAMMDGVQMLSPWVTVDLVMCRPWLDYRCLREVTAPLRTSGRNVNVRIEKSAWSQIPQREFHIDLTISCIKGVKLGRQLDNVDAEAPGLVKYGCRGFRGLPLEDAPCESGRLSRHGESPGVDRPAPSDAVAAKFTQKLCIWTLD